LEGKVAVVTGGSSGIGAATCRHLAQAGATVVVGYNQGKERALELVATLPGSGHRSIHMPIADTPTLEAVALTVEQDLGRCDILVNSAGVTQKVPHADLVALDDQLFDSIMRTNVRGAFATVRAFAPLLAATGDAVIINVSSISGFTGSGSNIAYCAAKAALDNMTMSLGRVLGPATRVLGVAPAAVNTGFVPGRDKQALLNQASSTPLQVAVEPDDVALTIVGACTHFRISTGTTFVVDGGKHL
jgi:3-oxoacyl-[acyl-carrier protein] reductase